MNPVLAQDGYLIARALFDPAEASALQQLAARAYAAVDAGQAPDFLTKNVEGWGGLGIPWLAEVGCGDFDLAELIERKAAPLIGPCELIAKISLFRRVQHSCMVTWHIDADGADTKDYDPCINVWIPLVAVGKSVPSLEIIQGSHRVMREESKLPIGTAIRSPEWVDEKFASSHHEVPQLEPGDALLFDHYAMHRTQPMAMSGTRISIECRVRRAPRVGG